MEDVFSAYIVVRSFLSSPCLQTDHPDQTNPKALPYKNTGFIHYDTMSPIMSKNARGTNAFRPSQQSRGAASNRPASSSRGRGRGRGRASGKGKGKEQYTGPELDQQRMEVDYDDSGTGVDGNIDGPSLLHPSPNPSGTVTSSTSASSSKRKSSALDDSSVVSSQTSSSKKPKQRSGTAVMENLSNSIASVSESISDMTSERRTLRLQQNQAVQEESIQSSEISDKAIHRLQIIETDLSPNHMAALIDRFDRDPKTAKGYMRDMLEEVRKAWIARRLKEEGFVTEGNAAPEGVMADSSE